jgi:hypothetical protein
VYRTFGTVWWQVGEFFLPGHDGIAPVTLVGEFLRPVPPAVVDALVDILPASVQDEIGVRSDAWVDELVSLLDTVRLEVEHDHGVYADRREEAARARDYRKADLFDRLINTVTRRDLLGFLGNRNVLPKYGFPVDTVELRLGFADRQEASKLELSRDLTTAIYEYAPGAEIVAGGRLWRSGGIYRLPEREPERRHYAACDNCLTTGKTSTAWIPTARPAAHRSSAVAAATWCRSSGSSPVGRHRGSPAANRPSVPGMATPTSSPPARRSPKWCASWPAGGSPRAAAPAATWWRSATARAEGPPNLRLVRLRTTADRAVAPHAHQAGERQAVPGRTR